MPIREANDVLLQIGTDTALPDIGWRRIGIGFKTTVNCAGYLPNDQPWATAPTPELRAVAPFPHRLD